jgi:hypothetical protein
MFRRSFHSPENRKIMLITAKMWYVLGLPPKRDTFFVDLEQNTMDEANRVSIIGGKYQGKKACINTAKGENGFTALMVYVKIEISSEARGSTNIVYTRVSRTNVVELRDSPPILTYSDALRKQMIDLSKKLAQFRLDPSIWGATHRFPVI